MKWKLYSRGTASGGASTQTSSNGGGSTQTSSTDGGFDGDTLGTESLIEGIAQSSWNRTTSNDPHGDGSAFHDHGMQPHGHRVFIEGHSHTVDTPSHSHSVSIPDHKHDMDFGIYQLGRLPTAVEIKVDGNVVPYTELSGENIDLIPYLDKDSSGKIIRGRWTDIEITPNDLGRITATVTTQIFIQSRGGGIY
jgi:hypothetical protein